MHCAQHGTAMVSAKGIFRAEQVISWMGVSLNQEQLVNYESTVVFMPPRIVDEPRRKQPSPPSSYRHRAHCHGNRNGRIRQELTRDRPRARGWIVVDEWYAEDDINKRGQQEFQNDEYYRPHDHPGHLGRLPNFQETTASCCATVLNISPISFCSCFLFQINRLPNLGRMSCKMSKQLSTQVYGQFAHYAPICCSSRATPTPAFPKCVRHAVLCRGDGRGLNEAIPPPWLGQASPILPDPDDSTAFRILPWRLSTTDGGGPNTRQSSPQREVVDLASVYHTLRPRWGMLNGKPTPPRCEHTGHAAENVWPTYLPTASSHPK